MDTATFELGWFLQFALCHRPYGMHPSVYSNQVTLFKIENFGLNAYRSAHRT